MPPVIAIAAVVASVAAEAVAGVALAGEALLAGEAIAGGIGLSEGIIGLGGLEAMTAGEIAGGLAGAATLGETAAGVIADGSLIADAATGSILGAGEGSLVTALAEGGAELAATGEVAGLGTISLGSAPLSAEAMAALSAAPAAAAPVAAAAAPIAAAAVPAAAGSSLGSILGGALGIGSAAAATLGAPAAPLSSGVFDVRAAAEAAAKTGQLDTFLAQNNTAAQVLASDPTYLSGLKATSAAVTPYGTLNPLTGEGEKLATFAANDPFSTTGATSQAMKDALVASKAPVVPPPPAPPPPPTAAGTHTGVTLTGQAGTDQVISAPYQEALTNAQRDALAQQLWTAAGKAGTPWDVPAPTTAPTPVAAAPSVTPSPSTATVTAPATTTAPATAGAAATGPSGISIASTPLSPTQTSPTAMSGTTASGQTYTGIKPVDSAINYAISHPGTTLTNAAVGLTPLGIPNTISGILGGPTIGSIAADATAGIAPDLTLGTAGLGLGLAGAGALAAIKDKSPATPAATTPAATPPLSSSDINLATFDPTATPGVTDPGTSADAAAALRKYLGLRGDPTKYGFGAEQQFYSEPAAAKGGYFDATQYFADGGMVQPLSPPTTPLVSAQPTMAFTDGTGAVGSIAQPPGLSPSDAYGSDAPHASPMAPSIAAAVPTMQPGLATLAVPNVNAAPVTSQVSQNPNVGYALGNSPLSNLTRS